MNIFGDCISYADDFLVICGANTRASLEQKVNDRLNTFAQVCATYELKLSEHKSLAMLFGRFLLENRHPIFKINNISIPVRTNITYLGFTLDPRFKWLEHLDSVNNNISSFTVNVAKTTRRDRGLSALHLKIWYQTVIAKKITYGYEVWYEDLNSHGQRKLSSCQRKGLLSILRPYKSISTDALCVLCGVPPLYLELKNLTDKLSLVSGCKRIYIDNVSLGSTDIEHRVKTYEFPRYYQLSNLSFLQPTRSLVMKNSILYIFTDGSRMESGTSAAFTAFYDGDCVYDYTIKLRKRNSIFQAEMLTIKYAIKWFTGTLYRVFFIYG